MAVYVWLFTSLLIIKVLLSLGVQFNIKFYDKLEQISKQAILQVDDTYLFILQGQVDDDCVRNITTNAQMYGEILEVVSKEVEFSNSFLYTSIW